MLLTHESRTFTEVALFILVQLLVISKVILSFFFRKAFITIALERNFPFVVETLGDMQKDLIRTIFVSPRVVTIYRAWTNP